MTAVMTSRAFDIPAGSGPAVLYLLRHAAAHAGISTCPGCPRCLETPVLNVLNLDTTSTATYRTRGGCAGSAFGCGQCVCLSFWPRNGRRMGSSAVARDRLSQRRPPGRRLEGGGEGLGLRR